MYYIYINYIQRESTTHPFPTSISGRRHVARGEKTTYLGHRRPPLGLPAIYIYMYAYVYMLYAYIYIYIYIMSRPYMIIYELYIRILIYGPVYIYIHICIFVYKSIYCVYMNIMSRPYIMQGASSSSSLFGFMNESFCSLPHPFRYHPDLQHK